MSLYNRVVGLDPSLAKFGVAAVLADEPRRPVTAVLKPPKDLAGHERIAWQRRAVQEWIPDERTLVVSEAAPHGTLAFSSENGGLWWILHHALWARGITVVIVQPSQIKVYATGGGRAEKDGVLIACVRRYPNSEIKDNNAADALTAAIIGAHRLGWDVPEVPKDHSRTLKNITWPLGVTDFLSDDEFWAVSGPG